MDGKFTSTTEEVAREFAVSISTVRKWVREGHIPPRAVLQVGTTYRFHMKRIYEALLHEPVYEARQHAVVITVKDEPEPAPAKPKRKRKAEKEAEPTGQETLGTPADGETPSDLAAFLEDPTQEEEQDPLHKTLAAWDEEDEDV